MRPLQGGWALGGLAARAAAVDAGLGHLTKRGAWWTRLAWTSSRIRFSNCRSGMPTVCLGTSGR